MASLRGTQYEQLFRDEQALDATFVDLLRRSDDPMAREVGNGLADGTLTKQKLAGTGEYADFVSRGLVSLQNIDYGEVLNKVADEQRSGDRTATRGGHDHDEDDDVWQGFDHERERRGGR